MRRLDEVFPSLMANSAAAKVFLKMDTQGYDLNVFHGAEGCLNEIRGLVSEFLCSRSTKINHIIWNHSPRMNERGLIFITFL